MQYAIWSGKNLAFQFFIQFQFPTGFTNQQTPSTEEASPLVEYTEDSNDPQETHPELPVDNRKWNNFVVNLNGGIKKATVFPDKDIVKSPLPYQPIDLTTNRSTTHYSMLWWKCQKDV